MSNKKEQLRQRRHARIRAKLHGTKSRPRLVIFRSLSNIYVQLIDDDQGKVLAQASTLKVKKGKAQELAKEAGKTLAEAAKKAKITNCVFDRNGYLYHGRVKALADGAREGGLKF